MSHIVVKAATATNHHHDTHHQIKEESSTNDTSTPPPPAPPSSSSSLQRRRPKPLSIPTFSSATAAASSYSSSTSTLDESSSSESEDLQWLVQAPPFWKNNKKRLSKQLSMCETSTPRDRAWEKRRHQIIRQESRRRRTSCSDDLTTDNITDEDLHELKACIELGFGFNEEEGQRLCNTLPALDLYFAVNRGLSPSPVSTPRSDQASSTIGGGSVGGQSSSLDSPRSTTDDSWKICGPGDNPKQVKTKLRHWAQAVACSVMQSSS